MLCVVRVLGDSSELSVAALDFQPTSLHLQIIFGEDRVGFAFSTLTALFGTLQTVADLLAYIWRHRLCTPTSPSGGSTTGLSATDAQRVLGVLSVDGVLGYEPAYCEAIRQSLL